MANLKNALIIGGGFSGMTAAIELRKKGFEVDLVEIDPDWGSYGAGLTLSALSLRALDKVGVVREVMSEGYCSDGLELFSADGRKLADLPTPRIASPDVPGGGGIMRSAFSKVLARATVASGVRVRVGCTFASLELGDDYVDVAFSDESAGRYELVVGADGLFSRVRTAIFPSAPKPKYTGQGVWRAVLRRPEHVHHGMMFLGPTVKAGLTPVSQSEMYLFVTENRPAKERIADEALLPRLQDLLAEFSAAPMVDARAALKEDSRIVYRPLEALLMPRPWYRGRLLLLGDAVHATTPHLASGAGIGIEDGIVLAEELASAASVDAGLAAFMERRWERCRLVVENSLRLGEIEVFGGSKAEHAELMHGSLVAIARPF